MEEASNRHLLCCHLFLGGVVSSPVPPPSLAEQPERHGRSHSPILEPGRAYVGNAGTGKGLLGNQPKINLTHPLRGGSSSKQVKSTALVVR